MEKSAGFDLRDGDSLREYYVYGLLPFCKQSVLMVLRCNCFRISGFLLGSALPEP
jgi:hypothetical protein